jgi:hypothetical protein
VHVTLLALLLLAATVDPRLAEPLRLLAELHDGDGRPIGAEYARLPDILHLTLVVSPLPQGTGGHYEPRTRTVTIVEALLGEDPRVLAAGLAHEVKHASDFDLVAVGLLPADCAELEARAFEAQAIVARAFWPDELSSGTDWEKGLGMVVRAYEAGGLDGRRAMVESVPGYQGERC